MKNSGIGGQAVIEGVMMKNKSKYAVSVRVPDKSIQCEVKEYHSITEKHKWMGLPFIRGTVNLVESMIIGTRTLSYSANFFEDEEPKKEDEKGFMSGWVMALTMLFSFGLALFLFMFLPQFLSELICKAFDLPIGGKAGAVIEGIFKILIFVLYIVLITLMDDIKRTFMYHGAEHKSINCVEHGLPLTVENVKKSSRFHKRCGTSFIIFVLLIAIIVHMFIPKITGFGKLINFLLRFGIRILLIPVIAGISYEFLRIAGRKDNGFVNIISKPGFLMQKLTTREPTDDMIEVAINSVERVFDWRKFLKENFSVEVEYPEGWENPEPEGDSCTSSGLCPQK